MSELPNNSSKSHDIEEEITSLEPLGLNEFLLPSSPLGQTALQLQFLHPLGATSITGLENWNLPSPEELEDNSSELMFREHPFFNSLVSDGITQPISHSSVSVSTNSSNISTSPTPSPSSASTPLEVTPIDTSSTPEFSPTSLPLQRQTGGSEENQETFQITPPIIPPASTESPTVSNLFTPSSSSASTPLEVTPTDTSSTSEFSPTSLPLQRQTDGSEENQETSQITPGVATESPTVSTSPTPSPSSASTPLEVTQENLALEASPVAQSELDPVNSETTANNLQSQPISTEKEETLPSLAKIITNPDLNITHPGLEGESQQQTETETLQASPVTPTVESTSLEPEPSPTINETISVEKPTVTPQSSTSSKPAEVKPQLKSTTLKSTEATISDRASVTPDTTNNINETELTKFVSSPTPTPETLPESEPFSLTETEIDTDSNMTVAQLLKDGNHTPLIPTVIENLSQKDSIRPTNPLGQSSQDMGIWRNQKTYFASSSNPSPDNKSLPPVIQKKPEKSEKSSPPHSFPPNSTNNNDLENQSTHHTINQDIPQSWSSLADLIGDTAPSIQRTSEQQFSPIQHENIVVTSSDNKSEKLHQNHNHIKNRSKSNSNHHSFIQAKRENNNFNPALTNLNFTTPIQREDELQTLLEDNSDSLEILAREIYHSIRQRLEIERERRGNYSSGRLPW